MKFQRSDEFPKIRRIFKVRRSIRRTDEFYNKVEVSQARQSLLSQTRRVYNSGEIQGQTSFQKARRGFKTQWTLSLSSDEVLSAYDFSTSDEAIAGCDRGELDFAGEVAVSPLLEAGAGEALLLSFLLQGLP
nr:hypothetical protein Iba_scaffold1515465CG0010 [Ipomoea batatas]GME04679.1 hypothetical protein Iba_scaffold2300CG0910 [Ipomoea batatas]GME13412.1 hypothetical protein Iba_scaffold14435CG0010 [Ipomoea batatas]GME20220.1 hypothetical protein Iba_scaffold24559CG0010 [Ipomoea batatas]GME20221.1 hypothetical protein Iba_scaffold24560CG0010 [Ipomoea batatas]